MRSMTGFAAKKTTLTINNTKVYVTISLKSVNARFFECICKFPYALHHLETDFIKLLKHELLRGHLLMSINVSDQGALKGTINASIPIAQSYVEVAKQIQDITHIEGKLTISDIIMLPHIFSIEEQLLDDSFKEDLTQLVKETITALIAEEEKEGKVLLQDIRQRMSLVAKHIAEIEKLHETFMTQRKNNILQEIQSYTTEDTIIETRKAALYYMLDKIDIHEEIVRFKSHLKNMHDLLSSSIVEIGKKLDFTLQELGREINTIAAKCSDAAMGSQAIDIKVELEKAREQVQNII